MNRGSEKFDWDSAKDRRTVMRIIELGKVVGQDFEVLKLTDVQAGAGSPGFSGYPSVSIFEHFPMRSEVWLGVADDCGGGTYGVRARARPQVTSQDAR